MSGRIGLLGGTFDPPHVGHLVVAQDALERLGLDQLIIVPAARPPHRDAVLDAGTRFDLVRDAFGDDPRIEVSDVELRRAGPSWTVDTVEWVHAERAPDILFVIVGADQLRAFEQWRRPDRILEIARLAVMTRPDEEVVRTDVPYESVEVTRVDLSSTRIRRRLEEGRSVRYLVPELLRERIQQAWAARGAVRGGVTARGIAKRDSSTC